MKVREFVGTCCAAWYFLISRGRIRGRRFIVRGPSLIRVVGAGRINIGTDVMIEKGVRLVARASLFIGEGAYIGKNATLVAFDSLDIGPRCLLGENVSIHTEDHGGPGRRDEYEFSPVSIGADAWICAGAVITRGVSIGERTTIGANAVVTRSVPSDVVAVGVPARWQR